MVLKDSTVKTKVLAKINLNGKSLGAGLVLRPGERVFLERYMDDARKFLFETYEVDANNPAAQQAIHLNGIVEVEFYSEYKPVITYVSSPHIYTYTGGNTGGNYNNNLLIGNSGNIGSSGTAGVYGGSHTTSSSYFANSCNCNSNDVVNDSVSSISFMETGRVEKGSNSNQDFNYDNTTFNSWVSVRRTWKILPESQKIYAVEDLKVFCTNCGTRRKKDSHKFCPNCGNKF
jgi:hypothetical protein